MLTCAQSISMKREKTSKYCVSGLTKKTHRTVPENGQDQKPKHKNLGTPSVRFFREPVIPPRKGSQEIRTCSRARPCVRGQTPSAAVEGERRTANKCDHQVQAVL